MSKPYIKNLRVEPYGWNVFFFNDHIKATRWLKTQKVSKETIDFWADGTASGLTSVWPEEREIYVGIFNEDVGTIAHECVHASIFILENAGIPIQATNHEALTYLVAHLVREFHAAAKAAKKSERKKS